MIAITSLWLPVVVSAVAVFFLSYLMWMVFPHHRGDWVEANGEDDIMKVLGDKGITQGQYMFPHCSGPEKMKDPEWVARYERGPSGMLIIRPAGPMNIAKSMVVSTVFNLCVSVLVAYIATIGLRADSAGKDVFRLTATVGFIGYAAALGWGPIWFSRTWGSTLREMFDGLVYGLATGVAFLYLWP